MRIGFLVWNQFQVAHSVEIARHFHDPDFIFIDRNPSALRDFDASWLAQYGAYTRFLRETSLELLDGEYDAIVAQFRPPVREPWRTTKLVMHQYSLAKPKTAYNSRWFSADHGLVYGNYSEQVVGQMCPVSAIGNPRFDPVFEDRLDQRVIDQIRSRLEPAKKTVLYQPTWGDLSSSRIFLDAVDDLVDRFNVIVRPHHMTAIRAGDGGLPDGVLDANGFPRVLDIGLYLNHVADVVVSDMSGAIFDALYCRKAVVLLGGDAVDLDGHPKADPTAIEVSQRSAIGPYVESPGALVEAIERLSEAPGLYRESNEQLVERCFAGRGHCAAAAADAIRRVVEEDPPRRTPLQRYAAPDFVAGSASRAYAAAMKRAASGRKNAKAPGLGRSFVKNQRFLDAGMRLERWTVASPQVMAGSIYQAFNANNAVRFSKRTWKAALSRMLNLGHLTGTEHGEQVLQQIGMMKTVAAGQAGQGRQTPQSLRTALQALGPLADFFDLAARNELASDSGQMYITPRGHIEPLDFDASELIAELYLSLSLTRELADEERRPYRSSQLLFAQNLFRELLRLGVGVYPRIQGGVSGVSPASPRWPGVKLTWHTTDGGLQRNIHLKLGSIFGHFVLDNLGYSGWGSPATMDLRAITDSVGLEQAESHWQRLYASLVEGNKSKYQQAQEAAPELDDYIFFPMQVANDVVARLADVSTLELLEVLAEWAGTSDIKVVVKRHPMCKSAAIQDRIAEAERSGRIVVSNANIHELISSAKCVITVNSGVGAEALLHLKPVVTTGGSDYAPATTRVRSTAELLQVLQEQRWRSASEADIKKFLYFYTTRYMVRYDDIESLSTRLRHLFATAGIAVPADGRPDECVEIRSVATELELVSPLRSPAQKIRALYAEHLKRFYAALEEIGVRFWLESAGQHDPEGEADPVTGPDKVILGVLVPDSDGAFSSIGACAERVGLAWRPISIAGVPVAAVMESRRSSRAWSGFSIAVRLYHEHAGYARSIDRVPLLANGATYPKARYLDSVSRLPAPLREKVRFLVGNKAQAAALLLDSAGVAERLRRSVAQRPLSPLARLTNFLFTEWHDVRIPISSLEAADGMGRQDGDAAKEEPGGPRLDLIGPEKQGRRDDVAGDRAVTRVGRSKARRIAREVGRTSSDK